MYVSCIIPYGFVFIFNGCLIYTFKKSKSKISVNSNTKTEAKNRSFAITAVWVTFVFVVCTIPAASMRGYLSVMISSVDIRTMAINITLLIRFSYHSYNIIMLSAFNKQFLIELKHLTKEIISNRVKSTAIHTSTI